MSSNMPECICAKLRNGNPFHKEGIGCPRPICRQDSDHLFTLLEAPRYSGVNKRYETKQICWYCKLKTVRVG